MAEPAIDVAPELGPEVEVTIRAAPAVGKVAILAVTLGMILSIEAIVRGFFGTVSGTVAWIPFAGSVISSTVHKVEQKVVSFLGGLEANIDQHLAHNIHTSARLLDQIWHSIEDIAASNIALGWAVAQAGVGNDKPLLDLLRKRLHTLEAKFTHITRIVTHVTKVVTRTVTHTVVTKVKIATVAVPRFVHHELLAIRGDVVRLKKAEVRINKEIKQLWRHVSQTGFEVALAAALGTAVLDAIKCSSLGNAFKNKGCNFWSDLEGLLSLLGEIFLFQHFCDLWAKAEPLFAIVLAPVVGVIASFADGACSHRPSDWEELGVPLDLPTAAEITSSVTVG